MNQNYSYGGQQSSQQGSSQQGQQTYTAYTSFHPTSSSYTVSSVQPSNSSGTTYIPNYVAAQGTEVRIVNAHGEPVEHRYIINQQGSDDKLAALIDSYFVDHPQPSHTQNQPHQTQQSSWSSHNQHNTGSQIQYVTQPGPGGTTVKTVVAKMGGMPELTEKERAKKERQAEAARLRYHALSADKKKELNARRTEAQRRKRQREKEMEQLEDILRQTNDIQEDPDITEQLREKRRRARWAEAARLRYQRMTPEQKAESNERRKRREQEKAFAQCRASNMLTGDDNKDDEIVTEHIKVQNKKKAEAARLRYHAMSNDQKRVYNQKRTDAFRRKRLEEEMLLTMPIGRVSGEVFDRAQQIVERNRKRAESARLRYQRMTPEQRKRAADAARLRYQRMSADQRKVYNQKRYTPKKARSEDSKGTPQPEYVQDDYDALSSIEREVMKRTQQAQQTLRKRQMEEQQMQQRLMSNGEPEPQPGPSAGTYVVTGQPGQQVHQVQLPGQQQMITVTKMMPPPTVAQLKQGTSQVQQVQHVLNPQGPYPGNIVVITAPAGSNPQTIYQTRDGKFQ
ncbi:unnamed protein product, partial [Mesorhabditis belari]|uniref:Uncharacterized protein n=1 Tax=Mesorhabditis belari TaxID=2138241 RepID=A0AAF3EM26_9BILA